MTTERQDILPHGAQYRYRGNVEPSAEVKRPVATHRSRPVALAGKPEPSAGTSATIDIFDVIDSYGGWWGISASEVKDALDALGEVDTIYVRLNSPGGEATEGVAIANLLRANKAEVRVTVYGLAASAASMVAVGGDVVNMAPGSILMVHDALNIIYGNADEMRSQAAVLDTISDSYAGVYAAKAGGTAAQWRAIMREDKWYSAEAAVAAKLADAVGLDPTLPDNLPPVEDATSDDATVIQLDIEINPAARAAARRADLSMYPHAPAALAHPDAAHRPPAEPQGDPSNNPKGAAVMAELKDGLRERFGFAEDASDDDILAAIDNAQDPDVSDAAIAKARALTPEQVKAALDGAKAGKVTVSQAYLDTVEANARLGAEARATQLAKERDEAITAKVGAGIISPEQVEDWKRDWDRDPASAKAELDKLTVPRFPVGSANGYLGSEHDGDAEVDKVRKDAGLMVEANHG